MSAHPYAGLPDHRFWRRSVPDVVPFKLDPVVATRFSISSSDAVATAGSCFAQHISARLTSLGFNYLVTEDGANRSSSVRASNHYGVFSARYGNLYTTRQLLQLFQEAYGLRNPIDSVWRRADGRFVDALRPQVESAGYHSAEAVLADRAAHLAAVRRTFEECAVFVFTLGLTEGWRSTADGTVFPLAPGVSGGNYDTTRHEFINFDTDAVSRDLQKFLEQLKSVNPQVKVLLTVSPVPLIATFEPRHVLVSNTYSKAVLRVAAESALRTFDWVDYFPSFEIITGNFNDSTYYESDYRSINALGVDHAMRCFTRHYAKGLASNVPHPSIHLPESSDSGVICDEEALDHVRV